MPAGGGDGVTGGGDVSFSLVVSLPRSALDDACGIACEVPDPDWISCTPMLLTFELMFMRPTYGADLNFPGGVPLQFVGKFSERVSEALKQRLELLAEFGLHRLGRPQNRAGAHEIEQMERGHVGAKEQVRLALA